MILFIQFHNKYSPLWFIIDNIQNAKLSVYVCMCTYRAFFSSKDKEFYFLYPVFEQSPSCYY